MNTATLPGAAVKCAIPKYSVVETERRWLVDLAAVGELGGAPHRDIEDRYIADSRLRLRRVAHADGSVVYKLAKKYGPRSVGVEPVTNIYLTRLEHEWLSVLPAAVILKRRYRVAGGVLDVHRRPRAGLAIFEMEFVDDAASREYQPPPFVTREITGELAFSGAALAVPGAPAA
jgi:CYTH domain-containing protein